MSFKFLILITFYVFCFFEIGKAESSQKSFRDILNNISTRKITSFDSINGRNLKGLPITNPIDSESATSNSAGFAKDQVDNNSKNDVIIYKQRSQIFYNGGKDESKRIKLGDGKRVGEN